MRILFIGGTRFVGRAMVESAVAAGHEVTVLHRGEHGADLFPEATHLLADRDGDLSVLDDSAWDATVDVAAYFPRQVRSLAEALDGRGGHHVFVSTVSVYADPPGPGATEDAALLEPAADDVETVTGDTYGPLKVACELAAQSAHGDALTIIRPTYVVGPHDPTGRYPWWVTQAARGGPMLAPGPPHAPFQVVDARDLGTWAVGLVERRQAGTFTAARPQITYADLLEATVTGATSGAQLVWVDGSWLLDHGVDGQQLPLWPEAAVVWALAMDVSRATQSGLTHRSLAETARDTLAWIDEVGAESVLAPGSGMTRDREAELLDEWNGRLAHQQPSN